MSLPCQYFLKLALPAALLCIFLTSSQLTAQVNPQTQPNVPAVVDPQYVEVVVPTVDGTLVWKDVAASLAESLSLDTISLERMFPTGSLDLRSPTTMLAIFGIDMAMGDAISIQMTTDATGVPALRFRCNKKALGIISPQVKQISPATIQIDDDWKSRLVGKPLVVCFHGLKSRPSKFDDFRDYVRQTGFATAAVSYDDHQSIEDSANEIFQIAKQTLAGESVELVLVGHSMGGLVARELTENPRFADEQGDGPKIVSLITVATPHGGSNWASLPPLLDFFAEGKVDSNDLVDVILHRPSAPGLRDLAPGSEYLKSIEKRNRKPGVKYTTIVGTGSPVSAAEAEQLRTTLQQLDKEGSVVRLIRPRIAPLLDSFDELAQGKGDGVVSADRATIRGVNDVVSVDLSHVDMFSSPKAATWQPVWEAILQRIKN